MARHARLRPAGPEPAARQASRFLIIGNRLARWAYQRLAECLADQVVAISRPVAAGFAPYRTVLIPNPFYVTT